MNDFEKYIRELAAHEDKKNKFFLNPRKRILVNAGIHLNWIGDFLANPSIKYKKVKILINKILFTGTSPDWNKILIDKCERSVKKFQELLKQDKAIKKKFIREVSYSNKPILTRGPDKKDFYRVLDGMHRFVGAVIKNRKTIFAYVPLNDGKHLPICEAHVVYDLIRGFQRHAKDEAGKKELYYALKLLARTYGNVIELLENRFNFTYVADDKIQKIIKKVIKEIKQNNTDKLKS
ncbi:hypothetical protein KKG58_03480 [Patescibacteria group bacterium]|nr:hypothetical protein [Patescibacteria group bacterium]